MTSFQQDLKVLIFKKMRFLRRGRGVNNSGPCSSVGGMLLTKETAGWKELFGRPLLICLIYVILPLYYLSLLLTVVGIFVDTEMVNSRYYLIDGNDIMDDCGMLLTTNEGCEFKQEYNTASRKLLLGGMISMSNEVPCKLQNAPPGLHNDGNTCFLASATQILITVPSIKRLVQAWLSKIVKTVDHD